MKVLIFGATGMVGMGVLLECLKDPGVQQVVTVGRSVTGYPHPKLREIRHSDLLDYKDIEKELTGFDACFFCLGVSSAGMNEADYTKITYDITIAAAETLVRLNPRMTFTYVTGQSTDSTEKGDVMWARVKGRTENKILRLPFKDSYMFRPGVIEAMDGIKSKTKVYRYMYYVVQPLLPIVKLLMPGKVLNTRQIGRAMLKVAREGASKKILEVEDIQKLG